MITIVYFCVLVPIIGSNFFNTDRAHPGLVYVSRLTTHTIPLISIIIDAYFNTIRFTLGHIYFPFLFVILYLIIDLILTFTTGMNAYPMLDYTNYLTALFVISFLILLFLVFIFGLYIHEKKYLMYVQKNKKRDSDGEEIEL